MTGKDAQSQTSPARIVRCSCGVELRDADENSLVRETQNHARGAHQLELSDEQVRSMMEVEQ